MTNELEKTFFETFGIEPKCYCGNDYVFEAMLEDECTDGNREKCKTCKKVGKIYQQITDRILLELMELLMKQQATEFYYHDDEYLFSSKLLGSNRPTCIRVKNLRELVLRTATCLCGFAPLKDKMLKQVRTLFEEGN